MIETVSHVSSPIGIATGKAQFNGRTRKTHKLILINARDREISEPNPPPGSPPETDAPLSHDAAAPTAKSALRAV